MSSYYHKPQPKNPALAAILSFLISGLGQIYNGEIGKGIVIIIVQVINAFLTVLIIGFVTGFAVWIWSIYDAYKTAEKINQEAGFTHLIESVVLRKTCPQCQAQVPNEARVCQYCGYEFYSADTNSGSALTTTGRHQTYSPPPAQEMPSSQQSLASTKICPTCGIEVPSESKFCIHCGYQFVDVSL